MNLFGDHWACPLIIHNRLGVTSTGAVILFLVLYLFSQVRNIIKGLLLTG